jgi:hypothetical protein
MAKIRGCTIARKEYAVSRPTEDHDPGETSEPIRRTWAVGAIVIALYAPQLWYFTMDYPWNDYRLFWLRFLPGLPAFVPGAFFRYPNELAFAVVLWSLTAMAAFGTYMLARRSKWLFYIVLGVLFVWSVASAVGAHSAFRA